MNNIINSCLYFHRRVETADKQIQTDRQMDKHTDGHGQIYRHTYRQTQTDRQRQADGQADRHTDGQENCYHRYYIWSLMAVFCQVFKNLVFQS